MFHLSPAFLSHSNLLQSGISLHLITSTFTSISYNPQVPYFVIAKLVKIKCICSPPLPAVLSNDIPHGYRLHNILHSLIHTQHIQNTNVFPCAVFHSSSLFPKSFHVFLLNTLFGSTVQGHIFYINPIFESRHYTVFLSHHVTLSIIHL